MSAAEYLEREGRAKKDSAAFIAGTKTPQEGDMLFYNQKTGQPGDGQEWIFYQGKWMLPPDLPVNHWGFIPF